MCGVPLPWWQEEIDKDKQEQPNPVPAPPSEKDTEECD